MTEAALNHRFRRLRAEALVITEGRSKGFDMKGLKLGDDMPRIQGDVDKNSTPSCFSQSFDLVTADISSLLLQHFTLRIHT